MCLISVSHKLIIVAALVGFVLFAQTDNFAWAQSCNSGCEPGTDSRQAVIKNGIKRTFLVHVPPGYNGKKKMPLVVMLHGGGGNYKLAVKMSRLSEKADREGFIVAYPNGVGRFGAFIRAWNGGDCCGYPMAHHVDDVAFLSSLIDVVENEFSIEPSKVYLAGFSNGAMLAYEAACSWLAGRLAAVAVVSGSMTGREPKPPAPVPLIIFHGTKDTHVPVEGGVGKLAKWGYPVNKESVDFAVNFWVAANHCSPEPLIKKTGDVVCHAYSGGKDGAEVIYYCVGGGKHAWPGGRRCWWHGDPPPPEPYATDLIWQFFSAHERMHNPAIQSAQSHIPQEQLER
jgi:polyhydroxybutyrate depolymerase